MVKIVKKYQKISQILSISLLDIGLISRRESIRLQPEIKIGFYSQIMLRRRRRSWCIRALIRKVTRGFKRLAGDKLLDKSLEQRAAEKRILRKLK
uniref:Uncharacterized protein n=1 Tax=Arsenophonus endosymbiont of Trialeurodes vaporariorum TaxID=235567 RepID=A0A3B0M398_9GAMM